MKHIVRKQVIDLSIGKELNAFSVQQELSVFYWDYVLPLFEKVFSELCGEDEVIMIDKLEIDLGAITEDDIRQSDEREKLLSVITEQLYDKIKLGREEGRLIKRMLQGPNIFDQWVFYMEQGFLPWNLMRTSEAWYSQVLESIASEYESAEALRQMILHKPQARNRIILQHSAVFLSHLIELLTAKSQRELIAYFTELYSLRGILIAKVERPAQLNSRAFETAVWEKVLLLAAGKDSKLSSQQIIQYLVRLLFSQEELTKILRARNLVKKIPALYPVIKIVAGQNGMTSQNVIDVATGSKENPDLPQSKVLAGEELSVPILEKGIPEKIEEDKIFQEQDRVVEMPASVKEAIREGTFHVNCGLVLLNPFIFPFFKNLRLLSFGKFVDAYHMQKGLYLLHYLATGRTKAEEHELMIPKVLCGYPLHLPVDGQLPLGEEELIEADGLLKEVVAQWEILKNTSPGGLREGFLQRNGKLFSKQEYLCLQLETSSIDMLLDYLPWNISVVKLPWMQQHVSVEWR